MGANKIAAVLGSLFTAIDHVICYCKKQRTMQKFKECGSDVWIGRRCTFTEKTISVGSFVTIGDDCCLKSAHGQIRIGNHVMFGPGVHIHGGNHPMREVGLLLDECEKAPGVDGFVTIEDDCWIGANAIILKGVTIGRGCVIGAGAIVTRDVPPYSIYAGSPGNNILKPRFSESELTKHKDILRRREICE